MIRAKARSDDGVVEVEFDATWYFNAAKFSDLVALEQCDWGGDYAADAVAEFCRKKCKKLFNYLELINEGSMKETVGYECYITRDHVLQWLKTNKPWWYRLFDAHLEGDSLSYLAILADATQVTLNGGAHVQIMSPSYLVVADANYEHIGKADSVSDLVKLIDKALETK